MPKILPDSESAHDLRSRLLDLFFHPALDRNARWWLNRELTELERDMRANGLL